MSIKNLVLLALLVFTPLPALAANAIEQFGDSVLGGLENLGQTLNQANSELLGEQPAAPGFEAQMRAYRQAEEARVLELSTASGVKPEIIREMRANGMTWEQIANKYDINLSALPPVQ